MGKLEEEVRKEIRRTRINSAIVTALAVSGGLAVAVMAPNVLGVLGRLGFTSQQRQNVKKSFSKLVERGYISVEHSRARLTPKGEKFAALLGEGRLAPKKPKRWDGKWRVLIFDIPERRRGTREQTRRTLLHLGFKRLQDSVWVYPYDCEDLITLFKIDFRLGKDLLYMVVDKIELDASLKNHFNL
ncbi:hypothetical protein HYS79_01670 [Patescibacteria group bacterium]|nr:hypothetical protein [Patescibacteria group bacterium]